MARFVYFLLILSCIPVYLWFSNQDFNQSLESRSARATLKPLFRECAQEHALFTRTMNMADVETLATSDKYILFGCVAESVAADRDGNVAQTLLAAIVEDYPLIGEPGPAAYLLPALYKARSYEAAEYLLNHTSANTTVALNPGDKSRFKGLTLPQYHAFYRRLDIAELFIRHGAILAPAGFRFRHWIFENQSARLTDPRLNEFLEKHGISIDEQDEMGRTVLLRALQDRVYKLPGHLIKLGADPEIADKRNRAANDLLAKAKSPLSMEIPGRTLPPRLAAISPARYSLEQNLRADPLPLDLEETLFLYDDEGRTRAERWNWTTGARNTVRLPLPAKSSNKKPIRYVTVNTEDGLWVLGPFSVLITREGEVKELTIRQPTDQGDYRVSPLSLPTTKGNPLLVALGDSSLLVLSLKKLQDDTLYGYRLYLRDRNRGITEFKELSSPAGLRSGSIATRLKDGRVLIVGGSYRRSQKAWLFDPKADSWQATGDLNSKRINPAIAALPDGRVFVAGNSGRVGRSGDSVFGAELWDPVSEQWSRLPDMPLSYGINAYHARGPSASALADGSLVIAGGMHNHVLLLRSQGESFAAQWTLAGTVPLQRVGARVQALDDDKVVVLGGWGLNPNNSCCWSRSGGEVLDLKTSDENYDRSIGLQHREPAIAHRKDRSFIAGGWGKYSLSSVTVQASAVAELISHDKRQVEPLSRLPGPMLYGRALWIDDDRILLKSVPFDKRVRSDLSHIDSRSLESAYRGYLAVYRISIGRWQVLDDTRIASAELAGLVDNEAILVGPGVNTWAVDVNKLSIRAMPERVAVRTAMVSRISRDGRIIVAGGRTQTYFIQAADIDCMTQNCPLRWFAVGSLEPSDRYEIWDPVSRQWHFSAIKQAGAEEAVIRHDGRVVTLGWIDNELMIEASTADGSEWKILPKPGAIQGAEPAGNSLCNRPDSGGSTCRLTLGALPAGQGDRVFLIVRQWLRNSNSRYSLWLFSDAENRWLNVTGDLTGQQLNETITLTEQEGDRSLQGAFFNTDQTRLWWE